MKKKYNPFDSTVAAISTPRGKGGIAVLRISGPDAVSVTEKVFFPKSGAPISSVESAKSVFGTVYSDGKPVDDCLATVFRSPHSYTGEDVVEISVHGGILLTETVLTALLSAGAKPAGPGEFTKRAYLNGKIDLTSAEAVADAIDSVSYDGLLLSRSQINGTLSRRISCISEMITDLLAEAYVSADYPDEDLSSISDEDFKSKVKKICSEIDDLSSTYISGRAVTEGIKTAIIGAPNAGKSSLLNRLAGFDRAIVTDIPGTTRDTLEETVTAGHAVLRLTDTAGIRAPIDQIERIGIERAKKAADESELIILVIDGSSDPDAPDAELINWLADLKEKNRKTLVAAVNKLDKEGYHVPNLPKFFDLIVPVSALSGSGIEDLKKGISDLFVNDKIDFSTDAVLSNARQHSAVMTARTIVYEALERFSHGAGRDVCAMDLEVAQSALNETDGRETASEITDRIFERFCVGK